MVDLRAVGQMHCSSRLPFLHRTLTVVSTTEAQCCSLERQPAVGSLTCHVSAWLVSGLLGATKMLFEVNEASAYFFTSNHWVIMHSQCQGCTENIRELEGGMPCPPSSSPPTVFYSCHHNWHKLWRSFTETSSEQNIFYAFPQSLMVLRGSAGEITLTRPALRQE